MTGIDAKSCFVCFKYEDSISENKVPAQLKDRGQVISLVDRLHLKAAKLGMVEKLASTTKGERARSST